MGQHMSFSDIELASPKKFSRVSAKLTKIDVLLDQHRKLDPGNGYGQDKFQDRRRSTPRSFVIVKMLFLQHFYNLKHPGLCPIRRVKKTLVQKGAGVNDSSLESTTRATNKQHMEEHEKKPTCQLDTYVNLTAKRGEKYFAYNVYISMIMENDLKRKRDLTTARPYNIQLKDKLLVGDSACIYMAFKQKPVANWVLKTQKRKNNKNKSQVRCEIDLTIWVHEVKSGLPQVRGQDL